MKPTAEKTMSVLEADGWMQGSKEGYRTKLIKIGYASIIVHRPILEDGEISKREKQIVDNLGHSLSGYLVKCTA